MQAQAPEIASSLSDHNGYAVSCYSEMDGSIDLTITGGTAPYTFLWSTVNGAQAADGATTEDLNDLTAGTYTVVVTDAVSESSTVDITLTQPPSLSVSLFSPDHNGYNIHCANGADGQISSSVSGGVSPYSYSWSNAATVRQHQVTFQPQETQLGTVILHRMMVICGFGAVQIGRTLAKYKAPQEQPDHLDRKAPQVRMALNPNLHGDLEAILE